MNDIKIGGKITLNDGEEYAIVKVLKVNGKDYIFCTTLNGKIMPAVFEYKFVNEKLNVRMGKNEKLVKNICEKIKNSVQENLE